MASAVVRLRRSLSVSSLRSSTAAVYSLLHAPAQPPQPQNPTHHAATSHSSLAGFHHPFNSLIGPRHLHSTPPSLYARNSSSFDDDKLDPDAILFEGCDYNHWLITMDFPKDPKPTPEEMVETYVQTLAKVVGSVEEAKKRMYACSTTTYHGFQAVMDEETSKKFEGMPGVVFVLPDSYIDPVNKEYGGDKYINGTIIPRPPPVQYGRQQRRSRNFEPNSGGHNQAYEGSQSYDRRSGQGDRRGYVPQQNYPSAQNHAPPGQGERSPTFTNNMTPVAGARPPHQGSGYNQGNYYQGNYNQGSPYPQQDRGYPTAGQRDHGFQGQGQGEYRENAFQGQGQGLGLGQGVYRDNALQGQGQGAYKDTALLGQGAYRDNALQGKGQGAYRDNAFLGQGQGPYKDNVSLGQGQGAYRDNVFLGQGQGQGQGAYRDNAFQGQGQGQGSYRDNALQGKGQGAYRDYAFQGEDQRPYRDNAFLGQGQGPYKGDAFRGQQQFKGQTQNFTPPPFQGAGFGQGEVRMDGQYGHASYGQGASENHGQGRGPGYGTGYTAPGENSRFTESSEGQNRIQGEGPTCAPTGEAGIKQGGY